MSRYAAANFDRIQRKPWTFEAHTLELAKQVGDGPARKPPLESGPSRGQGHLGLVHGHYLCRHITVQEQYYLADCDTHEDYQTTPVEIGDELADILHRRICIADYYGVNLEEAHVQARRAEIRYTGGTPTF